GGRPHQRIHHHDHDHGHGHHHQGHHHHAHDHHHHDHDHHHDQAHDHAAPGHQHGGRRRHARHPMTEAVPRLPRVPDPDTASGWRFDSKWVLIGVPVALLAWLALVPLVFLLWQSFLTPQTSALAAPYTPENFRTAYLSSDNARLFANSLQFAIGAAMLSLVIGTGLAWMNERTNT